jgi:hypothetical protein
MVRAMDISAAYAAMQMERIEHGMAPDPYLQSGWRAHTQLYREWAATHREMADVRTAA